MGQAKGSRNTKSELAFLWFCLAKHAVNEQQRNALEASTEAD